MTAESKKKRLIFLDNLKILFVILVIFTHVMVTYGGQGSWYYYATLNESNPVDIFTIVTLYMIAGFAGIFMASIMGLFFLMGGYFTPGSLERKGVASFWKERILRLGIPVLLYVLVINPVFYYLLGSIGIQPWSSTLPPGSFVDYYLSNFQSLSSIVDFMTTFAITWFLVVLLIFTAVYTVWSRISKIDSIQQRIPEELPIPRFAYLLLLAIGLGVLAFIVRIAYPVEQWPLGLPIAYMIQYFMMFSVGVVAFRYGWFDQMRRHHVKVWAVTIFAVVMLYFTYFFVFVGVESDYTLFFGGPNLEALVFALVDNILCMGMIFVLIKIFYAKLNSRGKVQKSLADNSFLVYLIHPFIVIPVSLGIAAVAISPLIKLAFVIPVSVFLCYLITYLIRLPFRKAS